jgi:hypothetical protein
MKFWDMSSRFQATYPLRFLQKFLGDVKTVGHQERGRAKLLTMLNVSSIQTIH